MVQHVYERASLAQRLEATRRVLGVWLPPARHLGPLLTMWAVSLVILIAEKDLGSSLLFFGVFLFMVYVATGRPSYTLAGLALFAVGATAAYAAFGHVRDRIAIWVDPFADASGRGLDPSTLPVPGVN